jgi:WS/DGAT/MGAT family acyltransferase
MASPGVEDCSFVGDRLRPLEAIMWRVGQDPTLRMTLGAVAILDRPPALADLVTRLTLAAERAPRLRRRPDDPAALRPRPAWIADDEPGFEDAHVRRLSVAAPGSMREVLDLIGLLEVIPFDPERSPWDVTLIEGLEGGRAALFLRAHHVLTDGVGGIRLLGLLLDEAAWPRRAPDAAHEVTAKPVAPAASVAAGSGARTNGDRPLGVFTVTIDVPRSVRRFIEVVRGGVDTAREVDPVDSGVRGVQRMLGVANSVSRQLMVVGGPLAERPDARSLLSRFEVLTVEGARPAALALGGSRNDLLVSAAAAGLGRYHADLGHPAPELRLATPTSQHRDGEVGGNWFAPARLEVPTAVGRPGLQFGVVVERLAQARAEPALKVASTLVATLGRLPSRVLMPALRAQAESVDFAATTVPGLRGERHLCGSRIETIYPLGPRLGCPMNITAFGNGDRLDAGIALDPTAFADPDHLVECLRDAFAGYVAAAGDVVSGR